MDREKVISNVTAIVSDMQEEVDEWKDYSDSELRGGLTCDCDWWYKTLQTLKDALALLKAQEPADYIPIDWLMNYAQLPTEFAISAWRKPKKEAEIKQAKSLDKPMSLDDAIELLKAQEPKDPVYTAFYDIGGKNLSHWDCGACGAFLYGAAWFGSVLKDDRPKYCSRCGRAVKWDG